MLHILKKLLLCLIVTTTLISCATPVTNDIALNKHEVQREEQIQHEMAKKHPPKKLDKAKHTDHAIYHQRLQKVAPALLKAAKSLCTKGECSYNVHLVNQPVLNAWADGKSINFTPIMLDFLDTDKELAVIMAHELSHNVMGHIGKKQQNSLIGLLFDVAAAAGGVDTGGTFTNIGASSYSQSFENEADYIALYIMAIAGYDISNVNYLWRKMSAQTPESIKQSFFSSHPSHAERFLRMQKTVEEINHKKAAGQPLRPNLKR